GAGDVLSVEVEVEGPAVVAAAFAQVYGVFRGGGNVDGVVEPLARIGPADEVSAARVAGGAEVHVVGAVQSAGVARAAVVVGDAFAAGVVVLKLDRARDALRRAAERQLGGRRRGEQHAAFE